MSMIGKTQIVIMWTIAPELEAEMDRLVASHAAWMTGHPRDGDVALLSYSFSKGPELANPLDPNSAPTGNLMYVLDEFYESPAGIARHWEDAVANWPDLANVVELASKGTVATLHCGTAVQALW